MRDRQSLRRLHHAQEPLARDATVLAATVATQIRVGDVARGTDGNRGQVVEHDRKFGIEQRPDELGQADLDGLDLLHQGIHGGQQPVVGDGFRGDAGNKGGFQPTQDSELGGRFAQAVEHHHPQQRLDRHLGMLAAEQTR